MFKLVFDKKNWSELYDEVIDKSILCSYDYVKTAEQLEYNGQACLSVFSIGEVYVLHPFIKRQIVGTKYFDLVSVYDFGGFWFNIESKVKKVELLKEYDKAMNLYANENMIVTEFIRLYPFFDSNLLKHTSYELEHFRDNIVIDLKNKNFEEVEINFSPNRRNQIRSAKKKLSYFY